MKYQFTTRDKNKIQKVIHKKYKKVAKSLEGLFKYPTGRAGLETLQYDPELLRKLPESVIATYCGVGNPFTLEPIKEGDVVLDVGCGAGVDTILTAMMAGPSGKVVGIDIMPEMLNKARENLSLTDLDNVSFKQASADSLPFPNEKFDAVISNGAFNLIPEKSAAILEVHRVLKPGRWLRMMDNVLIGELPATPKDIIKSWAH